MIQLLREIAGSGLIMQPSEQDLASPDLRPYLEKYMRGKDVDVAYKARLLRLAHDLAVSSFGMRQELYEYWHGGDPNRNRINLLRSYDQHDIIERIKHLNLEAVGARVGTAGIEVKDGAAAITPQTRSLAASID